MSLSQKEELELLALLTIEEKEVTLETYALYAGKYIKITDKKGRTVPLVQNHIQRLIDVKINELQAAGIPPRIIVLKPRQTGVSTDTQGRMIKETTTKKNRNGFIVSHEDPSTKAIFQKAKYMYDNLPEDIKPLQKASNATELIFDAPAHYQGTEEGLHSKIEIKTAGKAGIGRSETRHYVHASEFAFWSGSDENSPDKQLTGILNAVPDEIDTWVIIESTAKGYNHFKDLWDDAVAGNNGLVPMFFPWYIHEEYIRLVETNKFWAEVGTCNEQTREYIAYLYNDLKLPLERVSWWLWTLKNKCNNNINQMKQENPTTPEEAFIFSGTPVFDSETIQMRIEYLRQKYEKEPPKKGRFSYTWNDPETQDRIKSESIKWVDDPNGPITIYEDVKSGYPYVLPGDTKGEGHDFYAGTVINNVTGNRSAVLHMQVSNSKPYTWQMYCLGMYYNRALIGIEINFNTAPIEELQRLNYPRQYMRQQYDKITKEYQQKFGWKTDGNTRPVIIDKEIDLIENNIELFNDITMLSEALTFVYVDGRPDAMSSKHDDVLMSDMIGNEIRPQQSFTVQENPQPARKRLTEQLKVARRI